MTFLFANNRQHCKFVTGFTVERIVNVVVFTVICILTMIDSFFSCFFDTGSQVHCGDTHSGWKDCETSAWNKLFGIKTGTCSWH